MKIDIQYTQYDQEEISLKKILNSWLVDVRSVQNDLLLYRKNFSNTIMNAPMLEISKNKFKKEELEWLIAECDYDTKDRQRAIELFCQKDESEYTVINLPTILRDGEKPKRKIKARP